MTHLRILYIYSNESLIIVSPLRMYTGEGGGYYGLVIVTLPCPRLQTFLCERDYFKNLERIASILYMCDIWCMYGFGGLIDGYSALGVVYEVSLEVVLTTRA